MNISEFIKKYNGKFVDFDGKFGNQCVDLARQFIREFLGLKQPAGVEGAKDLFYNFEKDPNLYQQFTKIKNTLTFIPQAGDIVIWSEKYGAYGHIAICTGKGTVWSFETLSQNDPHNSPCILKTYTYSKVLGFLRKK